MASSLVLVWHCSLGWWIASLAESMTGALILGVFIALEVPLWPLWDYQSHGFVHKVICTQMAGVFFLGKFPQILTSKVIKSRTGSQASCTLNNLSTQETETGESWV